MRLPGSVNPAPSPFFKPKNPAQPGPAPGSPGVKGGGMPMPAPQPPPGGQPAAPQHPQLSMWGQPMQTQPDSRYGPGGKAGLYAQGPEAVAAWQAANPNPSPGFELQRSRGQPFQGGGFAPPGQQPGAKGTGAAMPAPAVPGAAQQPNRDAMQTLALRGRSPAMRSL